VFKRIMKKLNAQPEAVSADKQVTADHWSENMAGSDAFSADVYWLAVPAVQRRHQHKATAGSGHPGWVQYCLKEFLGHSVSGARMLSIGCGTGTLERELYKLNAFEQCDAVDIAPGALDVARTEALAIGASSINYSLCDIEQTDLPGNCYDAVWFNGSLHHIRELEIVCQRVRHSLKPGGWLFFNEYVGANHFAVDAQQCAAISHAFGVIPEPLIRQGFLRPGATGRAITRPHRSGEGRPLGSRALRRHFARGAGALRDSRAEPLRRLAPAISAARHRRQLHAG
jgi:2-polyprenyl-3-methyl-5-hydroxy-6-metoxy-1,4-benzoquinol methylase